MMKSSGVSSGDRVLILGATGFVGSRLVPELAKRNIGLNLLVRDPAKIPEGIRPNDDIRVFQGDLVSGKGLEEALDRVHSAYYLVHSMSGGHKVKNSGYAEKNRIAARNFMAAADAGGLKRIIYLGGLGGRKEMLSAHLKSRAEVGAILSSGRPAATVLRAAVIIGAGGVSFEMLRYLVERLPVMVCPKWIDTRIQPIALGDVLVYLIGCLLNPSTAGHAFDIGGPEILTYREMMHLYAEARGLAKRVIITVPVLTPQLSAYWVDLVTPVPSGIAHLLIEGLKNEMVCKDTRIEEFVPLEKTPFKKAVQIALSEERSGPGVGGS
ncbi:MAG: NAD(P)H-binding protein [Nitrospirae bacterium]|nr:NAD(P)H-binding protein [Nitrospirota bacterium]